MKFNALLTLVLAGALSASAQSQGYKDGIEYYKAGQYDNAKTILQNTFNNSDTDKALANYYLGETELALGNKAEAKKYFDAGVAADVENPYNYVGLGALDLLNKDAKAAEENFKKAQKLAKKNNEITVAIARAYYNADPVAYAKEVEKNLAKAHKDSKHTEASIYILEGDMLVDKEDYGSAAAKYEMATSYDKGNPEGYVKYANSYFRVNPQFSIDKLKEFLTLAPNSALAQRELAEKLFEGNYWKQAAEQYSKYIQNPNHFPQDKARYAVLQYYGEEYPQSLQTAKEVLATTPDNFIMQRLVFINEAKMQQFDQAIKDGEAFFKNHPNAKFTENDYLTLSDAYAGAGQDSLALVQVELAAEKFPENGDIQNNLSIAYTKNKKYAKAAEAYSKYIATIEEPSLNDLYSASGRWLNAAATAGDDEDLRAKASAEGLNYINKVLEQNTSEPSLYQRKARLLMASNRNLPNAEAVAEYQKMLDILNAKPENANKAALPEDVKKLYNEAYMFIVQYYTKVAPDEAKAKEYSDLYREINPVTE